MRRRAFLRAIAGAAGVTALEGMSALARTGSASFVIPMDRAQPQPLRAYGVVYRALREGGAVDWVLEHRGGAFVVHHAPALDDALSRGVYTEGMPAARAGIEAAVDSGASVAVRLEVAPEIGVYVPPYAAPWDDAVRLALEYAEIPYRTVWDEQVLDGLLEIDWLHLHHEDFTGQYGKYGTSVRASRWFREARALDRRTATRLGFEGIAELKGAVAAATERYVENGGFLFAMCAATETLDVALSSRSGDSPSFEQTLAFGDFRIEPAPVGPFSTIDGHRVNTPERRPLESVTLGRFAPTVDPVAAMLVQNHVVRMPDWYGLTTSFRPETVKPDAVVLATCSGGSLAKYVHGDHGEGTFTFLGGHDPEDAQHAVGDPPTDLSRHPRSPGYRLILNNVLFPAAEREERRT
ncbi:MAG: asparagine synthetase B [Gemmatimonadota bacterium]|nr:asparagine synthetase B [Gemmatimonadota bacterium]